MTVARIPLQSPIAGKGGMPTDAWMRFFQDLQQTPNANWRRISAAYTVDPNDDLILITAGTFNLKFPVGAPTGGKIWHVFAFAAVGVITFVASSGAVLGLASIAGGHGATVATDGTDLTVY